MDAILTEASTMATGEPRERKRRKAAEQPARTGSQPSQDVAMSSVATNGAGTPPGSEKKVKPKRNKGRGDGEHGSQAQSTRLDEIVVMVTRELLMLKQKVGALRCGSNFVVILRDEAWKKQLAEVCEALPAGLRMIPVDSANINMNSAIKT